MLRTNKLSEMAAYASASGFAGYKFRTNAISVVSTFMGATLGCGTIVTIEKILLKFWVTVLFGL